MVKSPEPALKFSVFRKLYVVDAGYNVKVDGSICGDNRNPSLNFCSFATAGIIRLYGRGNSSFSMTPVYGGQRGLFEVQSVDRLGKMSAWAAKTFSMASLPPQVKVMHKDLSCY